MDVNEDDKTCGVCLSARLHTVFTRGCTRCLRARKRGLNSYAQLVPRLVSPACITILPPGFPSIRQEEPLRGLSQQTPVFGRTQMAGEVVSSSCFGLLCVLSFLVVFTICLSYGPHVVFKTDTLNRTMCPPPIYMYSLLDRRRKGIFSI